MTKVAAAALLFVVLAATACSSARKGGPYGGMSKYDAGNAGHDIVVSEEGRPDSPIYNKELGVRDLQHGVLPGTRRAVWVVSLEDFDSNPSRYCLFLWGKFVPFQGSTVKYDIDDCPAGGGA